MAERTLTVKIVGDERDLQRAFASSARGAQQFEARMTGVSRSLRNVFAAAGISLGAVTIVRALRSTINAAIDFESSFAGVRKTVDATEPQLKQLASGFRELSTEIPISVEEINRIGESAGQLGVQTGAILDFTKTIAAIGVTTNLASEEAADAFARIANIAQLPQDQFDNLGSTVVELGNKLAATESEITEFGTRIAAAGRIVGLTVDQTLAIAGAFSSVGVEAEAGGTAVSKVFIALAGAAKSGGESLELFAKTAGVSAEEFRRQFQENSAGAFVAFVEGLKRVDDEGGNVFKTLKDLGLTDARLTRAFLSISQAGGLLSRSLAIGGKAWEENTALQEEAAKRYETTASKLQIFQNRVNDLQITLGEILAPELLKIIEPLGEWLAQTENQERVQRAFSQTVKDVAAVLGGLRDVIQPVAETVKTLADSIGGLDDAVKLLLISMAAGKVVGFAAALTGLGTAAAGATTQARLLRVALTRLLPFAVIVFSIEFITNYDKIQGQFTNLLRKANILSEPPTTKIGRLEQLQKSLERTAMFYGMNSDEVHRLTAEIRELERALGRLPELPGERAEGPTGPSFGQFTPGTSAQAQEKVEAQAIKSGDAIIARIERQAASQADFNQQLRDSETRAARLRDLIRADPENARLQQRLSAELEKQADLHDKIAGAAEQAAQAVEDAAQAARDHTLAVLDLAAAQAGLTKSLQDDLRVAQDREQALTRLRNLNRDDLDIAQQLVAATQARRDAEQQIAENKRNARQAEQFEILGLTATGEKRAPGIQALLGRAESLEEQVRGTFLDTPKTAQKFAAIAEVLAQGPKKVGRAMRLAILAMFNDITSALDQGSERVGGEFTRGGIRSTQKLLKGLGLTEEQAAELRRRNLGVEARGPSAFGFGLGGATTTTTGFDRLGRESGFGIVNEVRVFIGGQEVQNVITREQQKKGRRTAGSRRGRAGGRMGGV